MLTFKVLSLLLRYPTAEIHAALPELAEVLEQERRIPDVPRRAVRALIEELADMDLLSAQEHYVDLFDRGSQLSLHIFEHSHGESRERGPAMVQLLDHYQSCGFELARRELPDYLPLVLEFMAERPPEEALDMLAEAAPVLALLAARLRERGSRYAAPLEALEALADLPAEERDAMRQMAAEEGPDEAIVNMDRIWEEEAVTFMDDAAPEQAGAAEQPLQWHPTVPGVTPAERSGS